MSKKTTIFQTGVRLFASQGYEATTTLQVAREVGVTEPAVFYYFKSKNAFFSAILEEASRAYLDCIDAVALDTPTAFEALAGMIRAHFSIVVDNPEHMRIVLRSCPARLEDPGSKCANIYREARLRLKTALKGILHKGMASGEFARVDIDATANMLIAMLNGLMHQKLAALDDLEGVEQATVEFCRMALMKPSVE